RPRHCARHGAVAGDVGAAGGERPRGFGPRTEQLRSAVAAAHAAVRSGVRDGPGYDHARDLRTWSIRQERGGVVRCCARGLWRWSSRFCADTYRAGDVLRAPRHRHACARDRHGARLNIALKVIFVWGFGLGIAGVALGTSLGAWINVAILTGLG